MKYISRFMPHQINELMGDLGREAGNLLKDISHSLSNRVAVSTRSLYAFIAELLDRY